MPIRCGGREDPNIRIPIVQKTATEAETLGVIKQELESNAALKNS